MVQEVRSPAAEPHTEAGAQAHAADPSSQVRMEVLEHAANPQRGALATAAPVNKINVHCQAAWVRQHPGQSVDASAGQVKRAGHSKLACLCLCSSIREASLCLCTQACSNLWQLCHCNRHHLQLATKIL